MKIEFTNGATVHRCWQHLPDGELVAAFQYEHDAKKFVALIMDREETGNSLVIVDHSGGKLTRLVRKADEKAHD
ncbi:MAG: hypothetical protein OEQ39_04480 [Gammaproteobacteria bacterium]|nr:hypothetical protein [Gammaproteobacteria bacterium]